MLLTILNFLIVIFLWMQRREHCATIFSLGISWYLITVAKALPPITLMDIVLTIVCVCVSEHVYNIEESERKIKECLQGDSHENAGIF